MKNLGALIFLVITVLLELFAFIYIRRRSKRNNKLISTFIAVGACMTSWGIGLIIQIFAINFLADNLAIYFDYLIYVPIVLLPIALYYFASVFEKEKNTFSKKSLLLFVIPILTVIILWTNDLHHLFYKNYSTSNVDTEFGPYFIIYSLYTYGLLIFDIIKLIKASIKHTNILSIQSVLIIIGAIIPIVINVIGFMNIVPMSIYTTPISLSFTILLWGIAIFKYDFLSIAPIALSSIVNQMSDAYVVLNINNRISDCNSSFEKIFGVSKKDIIDKNFEELEFNEKINLQKNDNFGNYLLKAQTENKVFQIDAHLKDKSKYFTIEISGLMSDYKCVGILFLFKDTTQHIRDMEALKNNQDILMERERLATLGQMVGGIAHNLKTPIMSIAGAVDGLQDLVTEYEKSIDDDDVTKEDHHSIAHDMSEWITKINSYDAYMSDVITAVKGQTANFSSNTSDEFTIDELLKRVNILMRHELKSALVTLNTDCQVDDQTTLTGNVNSLVQIVNNLISNAIQSYKGEQNKSIDLTIFEKDNNIVINIKDYGCGIPEKIQKKLFNEMVTTKGHNGTGLGLFMSYSTIKGHFNGDLTFESEEGKGTSFNIIMPIK
ncbi:MAG: PAS domain-containing protein [Clostridia bacterium]|nr:PAS domain-containing protein [Clostridia bacterium]